MRFLVIGLRSRTVRSLFENPTVDSVASAPSIQPREEDDWLNWDLRTLPLSKDDV